MGYGLFWSGVPAFLQTNIETVQSPFRGTVRFLLVFDQLQSISLECSLSHSSVEAQSSGNAGFRCSRSTSSFKSSIPRPGLSGT